MIDPDKFCSLCHATFNDPVMAQQHYVGKKHRKQETKLKLMAHYGRLADPAVTDSSGKSRLRAWPLGLPGPQGYAFRLQVSEGRHGKLKCLQKPDGKFN